MYLDRECYCQQLFFTLNFESLIGWKQVSLLLHLSCYSMQVFIFGVINMFFWTELQKVYLLICVVNGDNYVVCPCTTPVQM